MKTPSVQSLIAARLHSKSQPNARDDRYRLALVIEGGAMRAVTAGGMVSSLEAQGMRSVFDGVFGSSAGAVAGAYFVAGQARFGSAMFYEYLNTAAFIDRWRFLTLRPIMDTSYLIDRIMRVEKRLDVGAILGSSLPLHVVATDIGSGTARALATFADAEELFQFVRATVTMPLIGGRPVMFRGREYLDGGMVQQVAVESAIAWGATHILTLLTRPEGDCRAFVPRPPPVIELMALHLLYGKAVADLYRLRGESIARSLELCFSSTKQQDHGVRIQTAALPDSINYLSRLTRDGDLLRRGEREAFQAIQGLGLAREA